MADSSWEWKQHFLLCFQNIVFYIPWSKGFIHPCLLNEVDILHMSCSTCKVLWLHCVPPFPLFFNLRFTRACVCNNLLKPPLRIFSQYLKTAEKGCFTLKRPYLITVNLKIRLIYILVLATFRFSGSRLGASSVQGCWIMRVSQRADCYWLLAGMTFVSHGNSTYP